MITPEQKTREQRIQQISDEIRKIIAVDYAEETPDVLIRALFNVGASVALVSDRADLVPFAAALVCDAVDMASKVEGRA